MDKVDVVIPLFNGAKWIRQTLKSVLNQSLKPDRIIVVDDGSTDGSKAIVAEMPGVILLQNPDKGCPSARNYGFQYTKAPFIAFLDHDDVWHNQHLELLYNVMIKNQDVDLVASREIAFVDGALPRFDISDKSSCLVNPWDVYPSHSVPCTPSLALFRREGFIESGKWTAEDCGISDYVLLLKMCSKKSMIRLFAKTVAYRKHEDSMFITFRRRTPEKYLEWLSKTEDKVMKYFINSVSDMAQQSIVMRRNRIAHILYKSIYLFVTDNELFNETIITLEKEMKCESSAYLKLILSHFYYLLIDCFTPGYISEKASSIRIKLVDKWPRRAHLTKNALWNVLIKDRPGLDFYKTYFLKKTFNMYKLYELGFTLKQRISFSRETCPR